MKWCPSSSAICLLQTTHNMPTEVLQCYSQHTGIWKSLHNTNLTDAWPHISFYFLWSGNCRVQVLAEARDLSLLQNIQAAARAQSAHYSLEIRGSLLQRIELPKHECKHTSTSSDEFKNECGKAPTPPTWQHTVYSDFTLMNGELILNKFHRCC